MTRSTLSLSLGLAFVVVAATLDGCGGSSTGGTAGTSGGSAGTSGGTAGTSGGSAGTSGGNAGTSGGNAGTNGGNAGTGGLCTGAANCPGNAGTNGNTAGTSGSTAGTSGGTAGAAGGTAGAGGRGGTTGGGGRGGSQGDAGTSGGGRGGNAGAGAAGRGGTTGGGGRGGSAAGGSGGASASLTLTSTAFTEGMTIPAAQTCTGNSHMSPPLTWTAGPAATMSYAITLTDMTNGFVHWVIWDMPATTTSLPGNLPKTSRTLTTPVMGQQVNRFTGDGYFGPCPSGSLHTYVFEVWALDVATLPNVPTTPMPEDVRTQLMAHVLATGTLSGTSNASQ